jgi:hypothetical protein
MNTQQLMQIVEMGNSLVEDIKGSQDEDSKYYKLVYLIRIETMLDSGRMIASICDGLEEGSISTINTGMDKIRDEIVLIMNGLDKKRVKELLYSAGEAMKTNFMY